MEEKEIYKKVLNRLFEGLGTENHDKYKNDRNVERTFAVDNLYPDIILTKKGTKTIEFVIEIVTKEQLNQNSLLNKWGPLSKSDYSLFLLVPKSALKQVEQWCAEQKIIARFGTYEIKNNESEINFY